MGTTLEIQISVGSPQQDSLQAPAQVPGQLPKEQDKLENQIQFLISTAFERAHSLARSLSYFDPESLLSQFNRLPSILKKPHSPSPFQKDSSDTSRSERTEQIVFEYTLQMAEHLAARFPIGFSLNCNGGPTVDLSGIAKGMVVDEIYNWISFNLENLLFSFFGPYVTSESEWSVNAGGDLRLSGVSAVEIRVPSLCGEEKRYNLQMLGSAVATSSHQGLNTTIGTPAARYAADFQNSSRAATVTVIAETCCMADAFTKIAFQYDLSLELSNVDANDYGLLAVLSFDGKGEMISAHEWSG